MTLPTTEFTALRKAQGAAKFTELYAVISHQKLVLYESAARAQRGEELLAGHRSIIIQVLSVWGQIWTSRGR